MTDPIALFFVMLLFPLFLSIGEFRYIYSINGIREIPYMEKKKSDFYEKIEYGLYTLDLPFYFFFSYSISLAAAMAFFEMFVHPSFLYTLFIVFILAKSAMEYHSVFVKMAKEAYSKKMSLSQFLDRRSAAPMPIGEPHEGKMDLASKEVFLRAEGYGPGSYEKYREEIGSVGVKGVEPVSQEEFDRLIPYFSKYKVFFKIDGENKMAINDDPHINVYSFVMGADSVYKTLDEPLYIFYAWKEAKQIGAVWERFLEVFVVGAGSIVYAYFTAA